MSSAKKRSLIIRLNISADECLKYYQRKASMVIARAENGLTVSFPANRLHAFLGHDGVHGRFELVFDEQNKFIEMKRLS